MSGRHEMRRWTPYLMGALAGLLAIGSAYATTRVMGKTAYLGVSTTFVRAAGFVEQRILPERVKRNAYFKAENIKLDWQAMVVCGIFLGALVGSVSGRAFEWEGVPPLWRKHFGTSELKRAFAGFLGGVVAMFGVRLADGCPTGHGLSGVMQLSVSGVFALLCFFLGGLIIARQLYNRGDWHE